MLVFPYFEPTSNNKIYQKCSGKEPENQKTPNRKWPSSTTGEKRNKNMYTVCFFYISIYKSSKIHPTTTTYSLFYPISPPGYHRAST